jgi:hypothetical protein
VGDVLGKRYARVDWIPNMWLVRVMIERERMAIWCSWVYTVLMCMDGSLNRLIRVV